MPVSVWKQQKIQELKTQAQELYKEGLSTREVGKRVGRSHTWVANAVAELVQK